MLLIASLSLYTSYTANIVALLQSTTDSIKTLSDLLHSSITLGVLDIVYYRYFFKVRTTTIGWQLINPQNREQEDHREIIFLIIKYLIN